MIASVILSSTVFSQETKEIAVVIKVSGPAQLRAENSNDWTPLKNGRRLNSGDFIKTGKNALVSLVFTDDKSMMKIRSESEIQLQGERTEKGIKKKIETVLGQIWQKINPKGAGYEMVAPSGVAAVRGTEFYVTVDENGRMMIFGISGTVALATLDLKDEVLVTAGKTGTIEKGGRPVLTDTKNFEPWADTDDTADTLDIEFQDANGNKKSLKLKYQD